MFLGIENDHGLLGSHPETGPLNLLCTRPSINEWTLAFPDCNPEL